MKTRVIYIHTVAGLIIRLSAEGAKNFSWPWLSSLRGWVSLTEEVTSKFVYIYIYICNSYIVMYICIETNEV